MPAVGVIAPLTGNIRLTGQNHVIAEIAAVGEEGQIDVLEVARAGGALRPCPRLVQCRHQHRGENGDDSDNDEKFDQRKWGKPFPRAGWRRPYAVQMELNYFHNELLSLIWFY